MAAADWHQRPPSLQTNVSVTALSALRWEWLTHHSVPGGKTGFRLFLARPDVDLVHTDILAGATF